ncbi:MAG: 6,7-dimethyl-8-ribityllumazine synthase [Flavobacteriaceae bacterium]|nr:6,7-dimethyl-8-ribityllumazine synthase [Flavobacteriaceae bacterium]MCY4266377.1 6,7-dimethyl-8-ribityllumazine synthase [Flavobacteriaceae bacterium]MCY4298709.1 6,7-dimethyl-8-ribityllumazine synthase [Flavobacteriaceae bacterium]
MSVQHHISSNKEINILTDGVENLNFILVVSQWNKIITDNLYRGAQNTLKEYGVTEITKWNVPGSFELIYGCCLAQKKNPNAVIAIGSVIKGQTPHFDYICQAVTQGIKDLNTLGTVPVIFCVLTDNTIEQAQERSGGKFGNKGSQAALAALEMAQLSAHSTDFHS